MCSRAVGVLVCLGALACAGPDTSSQDPAQMALREDLLIGSDSSADYALTNVTDLVRDVEGNFLVVQPTDQSVWKYNSAGQFQSKIGRAGGGPGEFSMPAYVGFAGRSLWVSDPGYSRLTFFTEGRLDSVITPRVEIPPLRFVPTSLLADGSVFSRPAVDLNLVSAQVVTALPLLRLYRQRLDTIAMLPLAHAWWIARDERRPGFGAGYTPQPLADDPLFAVSPDGSEIVLVNRSAAAPTDHTISINRYRYDGHLKDTIALRYSPLAVAEDRTSALISKRAEFYRNSPIFSSVTNAARALAKSLYVPDHLPPATQVVAASDGRIWIRREETGDSTVLWWVIGATGRLEWEFPAPKNLTLFYANDRSAAGIILDELEIPHVVAYTLTPKSQQ